MVRRARQARRRAHASRCRSPCSTATRSTRSPTRLEAAGLRRGRLGVHLVRRAQRRARGRARLLPAASERPHGQRARPAAHAARPDATPGSRSPRASRSSRWRERLAEEQPRLTRRRVHRRRQRADRAARAYRPPGVTSLEGLLFPDTYQVSNADNEAQVVERMVTLMERVAGQEDLEAKAAALGRTPYEILDRRLDDREGGQARRGPAQDRPRDLQPAVRRHAAPDRRHAATTGNDRSTPFSELRQIDTPVQHVPAQGPAADADRQPRPGVDPGCAQPGPQSVGRRPDLPGPARPDARVRVPLLRARQRGRRTRLRRDGRAAPGERRRAPRRQGCCSGPGRSPAPHGWRP